MRPRLLCYIADCHRVATSACEYCARRLCATCYGAGSSSRCARCYDKLRQRRPAAKEPVGR